MTRFADGGQRGRPSFAPAHYLGNYVCLFSLCHLQTSPYNLLFRRIFMRCLSRHGHLGNISANLLSPNSGASSGGRHAV